MKKRLPYRLCCAGMILGLTGLTLLPGCKNDDEPKLPEDNTPHHNTTYTFGYNVYDQIFDFGTNKANPQVAASADSASVDTVFLKASVGQYGIDSWYYIVSETTLKEKLIEPVLNSVSEKNRHKIRGTGTMINTEKLDPEARKWLEDFGFEFIDQER
ncbi:MAG: hypothetical protein J1E02_09630 [Coprobacter sp.]|nr:hypothetical protein [Coprobacter sp.]